VRIGLYGYTDKRPFLYNLICALQASGDVAVITANRQLKRLTGDRTDLGYFGNTLICVTDLSPDEVWSSIGYSPDDFHHVIYDLTDSIADVDKSIFILGSEFEDGEEDFMGMLTDVQKIKLMYDGKQGPRDFLSIPISADYMGAAEQMERNKVYMSFRNKQLEGAVVKLVAKEMGLTESGLLRYLSQHQRKR